MIHLELDLFSSSNQHVKKIYVLPKALIGKAEHTITAASKVD